MSASPEHDVAVIIPALNEEQALPQVLEAIPSWANPVIVVDNGSTDHTADVAAAHGATVVHEPRRGYGAACLAGLAALDRSETVVFLSGDHSDDPGEMDRIVDPIRRYEADMVIGSRVLGTAEPGSLSWPQRFGNALASRLLRHIWNVSCTDLGPFRAVRFDTLRRLMMSDLGYGWTVQMQARAARLGVRVIEVPVRYRRRAAGRSKISGTLRGTIGAGVKILGTIAVEAIARRHPNISRRRLVVFTRYPLPGSAKTRLIPAIGADAAAELQMDMTHHTLATARAWSDNYDDIEVRYTGGTYASMVRTFGRDLYYAPQRGDTLGERMADAAADAFRYRCDKVVIIGCDCPGLDAKLLRTAFHHLRSADVVLGPAKDGGYYLIGLRRDTPGLFDRIAWGTNEVLRQTLDRAAQLSLTASLLPELCDVDEPDDLGLWYCVKEQRRHAVRE